jgi:hypothetical protein
MDVGVLAIAEQFRVSTNLFVKALDGLDRDALLSRAGPRSNPPIWIAGHLAQSRVRIINILGGQRPQPWTGMFDTGSVIGDLARYPEASVIIDRWIALSEELMDRLEHVTAEQLNAPPPPRVASPDDTLRGALALLAFHDGYHVGQLGFLRKWLGVGSLLD